LTMSYMQDGPEYRNQGWPCWGLSTDEKAGIRS
jgi:hypothetical protein